MQKRNTKRDLELPDLNEHNDNDIEASGAFFDAIEELEDDAYMDEPFPTTQGTPIDRITVPIDEVEAFDQNGQGCVPQDAPRHASQHVQQAPVVQDDAISHDNGQNTPSANAEREFKPAPILVPVPNPVGRSKIRKEKQRRKRIVAISIVAVVAVALAVFFLFPWDRTITMNGDQYTIKAHTTLQEAAEQNDISVTPGDFLAIDGSVIEAGKGIPYTFTVNGEAQSDPNYEIQQNDVIEVTDGADITEEFTEEMVPISAPVTFEGIGAVHKFEGEGTSGVALRRTGQVSGISQETIQSEPSNQIMRKYNIDSGDDKVIALTFDDGPWKQQTNEILDVLAANDAKATFFTVGERIAGLEDVVKRAHDEGHQVSTHSWDHASGSGQGVNLDYMTDDEQREEISKGLEAISQATGEEASNIVRVPGGNLSENTARILSEFATSEIGWNIDTNDWRRPGAEAIFNALMQATPGDIILMHDGGGDRSQTVQALRDALPILAQEGYRFITIEELVNNYPADGQESS